MMKIRTQFRNKIRIPISLGVFEDCVLTLRYIHSFGWDGTILYPETISIRQKSPYVVSWETRHQTEDETTLLFYPSNDMEGGYYAGEPTAVLEVRIRHTDPNKIRITLDLDERIQWRSDI